MPGTAKQVVLGSRSTSLPKITAPSRSASRRSRSGFTFMFDWATAPKPAIVTRFSVPARRRSSWPPPWMSGSTGTPSRTTSAPTPTGPPNLCADNVMKSTDSNAKFNGSLPRTCTASLCTKAPCACARRTTSATGCTTPVSLLASMTLTRAFGPCSSSCSASRSTTPLWSTGMMPTGLPEAVAACSTAGCSTAETIILSTLAPFSTMLLASLPLPVNTTIGGITPTARATCWRASSSNARAARPSA